MHAILARLRTRILPELAPDIRDEFFVHAATELQRHAPWLFTAMFINSAIAMVSGAAEAHWIVRLGLPGLMGIFCLFSLWQLRTDWDFAKRPWRARRFLRDSALSSVFGAIICTSWCVLSWLAAPADARLHFPIILVMGGLATAYCLANVRIGAFANLAIDIVPIAALMILSGNRAEFAAAISLLLAGLFQMTMITAHHRRNIELLTLRNGAREQANSDPLTGLANRRAMWARMAETAPRGERQALILIDVDHFKSINDSYGHDVGDVVLCEIAEIVAACAPPGVMPVRVGGEEFALFGPAEAIDARLASGLLQQLRSAPMPHGRQVTASIGIAEGRTMSIEGWNAIYRDADRALYRAKRDGRDRAVVADADIVSAPAPAPSAAGTQAAA